MQMLLVKQELERDGINLQIFGESKNLVDILNEKF